MNDNDILVFDLETKRLADEVGGWSHVDKLGFSGGVTYHVATGLFSRYLEEHVGALLDALSDADRIVGFNLLRFDYKVLQPYGLAIDQHLISRTTDLLLEIYDRLGFRVSLDSIAAATLGAAKIADGVQAVQWYRQGDFDKILDYCQQDVQVTHDLWAFGKSYGFVQFRDKWGAVRKVPVSWR